MNSFNRKTNAIVLNLVITAAVLFLAFQVIKAFAPDYALVLSANQHSVAIVFNSDEGEIFVNDPTSAPEFGDEVHYVACANFSNMNRGIEVLSVSSAPPSLEMHIPTRFPSVVTEAIVHVDAELFVPYFGSLMFYGNDPYPARIVGDDVYIRLRYGLIIKLTNC